MAVNGKMTGSRPWWSTLSLWMTPLSGNQESICHDDTGQKTIFGLTKVTVHSDKCQCGKRQTMFHIVNSCAQTKLEGGHPPLHFAKMPLFNGRCHVACNAHDNNNNNCVLDNNNAAKLAIDCVAQW